MLGWMNDSLEKFVVSKYGTQTWHSIKAKANVSHIRDGGYVKHDSYDDQTTRDLIVAAAASILVHEEKGESAATTTTTSDHFLQGYGRFFLHYLQEEGFQQLLTSCQGRSLKEMLSNINEMHDHVQSTFCPKPMIVPQFWVEEHNDDEEEEGDAGGCPNTDTNANTGVGSSLVLHYHSQRGNFLAPFVEGMVMEMASSLFKVEINMTRLQTQGKEGSDLTSWTIEAANPKDQYKLILGEDISSELEYGDWNPTQVSEKKCPFTGMKIPSAASSIPRRRSSARKRVSFQQQHQPHQQEPAVRRVSDGMMDMRDDEEYDSDADGKNLPSGSTETSDDVIIATQASSDTASLLEPPRDATAKQNHKIGLSGAVTDKLFPYHVLIDTNFQIVQVGKDLPSVLDYETEQELIGQPIKDVLSLKRPTGMTWNWKCLQLLEDQSFELVPVTTATTTTGCATTTTPSPEQNNKLSFKTTIVHISDSDSDSSSPSSSNQTTTPLVMLILTPNAQTLQELNDMDLTINDLPVHGGYRDTVFLGEHLSTQMNQSLRVEKLTRHLQREMGLLESLLPTHAAENLRKGKLVQPMLHQNVTFFFSDIVGFTSICNKLYPGQVIEMLNQLYCVMDFLATKFGVFKIETIGDAYVCASGLPHEDPNHAKNVSNFAIAVNHCAKQVLSPIDKQPIQLRIGIHTGQSASGVVGVTNPRYCVFGDTVNTTARHESSGMPGKIHCSETTQAALMENHKGSFQLIERGKVEMKGLGQRNTFWLEGSQGNELTNQMALAQLEQEVKDLLVEADFSPIQQEEEQMSATTEGNHKEDTRSSCCSFSSGGSNEIAKQVSNSAPSNLPAKQEFRMLRRTSIQRDSAPSIHDMARIGSIMRKIKNGETAPAKNFSWTSDGSKGSNDAIPQRRTQSFSAERQQPTAKKNHPRTKSFSASRSLQHHHPSDVRRSCEIEKAMIQEGPTTKKRAHDAGTSDILHGKSNRVGVKGQTQVFLAQALKRRKTVTAMIRKHPVTSLPPKPEEAPAG